MLRRNSSSASAAGGWCFGIRKMAASTASTALCIAPGRSCRSPKSTRRCSPERQSKYPREEGDHAMTIAIDRNCLSPKRGLLCSRENALRVAGRIFDPSQTKVSILRTSDPLTQDRKSVGQGKRETVRVELGGARRVQTKKQ